MDHVGTTCPARAVMSPKWGHLIIIGTMWLTIHLTLGFQDCGVHTIETRKYFLLCFDTLLLLVLYLHIEKLSKYIYNIQPVREGSNAIASSKWGPSHILYQYLAIILAQLFR